MLTRGYTHTHTHTHRQGEGPVLDVMSNHVDITSSGMWDTKCGSILLVRGLRAHLYSVRESRERGLTDTRAHLSVVLLPYALKEYGKTRKEDEEKRKADPEVDLHRWHWSVMHMGRMFSRHAAVCGRVTVSALYTACSPGRGN